MAKPAIISNTLTNGISSVVNAVITVILTPILISKLGSENYGLWSLLLSASYTYGYLAIGDLGLGEFMLRSVPAAKKDGGSNEGSLAYITSNSLAASVVGGLSVIGIASVVILFISHWGLSKSFDSRTVFLCIALILCEVFFETICSIFRGFVEGQGQFRVARSIDTSGRILWGVSAALILFNGGGVTHLAAATAFISLSRLGVYSFCSRRVDQPLIFSMNVISPSGIIAMMKGGIHFNGLKVLYSVYSQMDRSIIAIFLTISAITTYDIAFRFFSVTVLLLATASSAVIPVIASQHSRGDFDANKTVLLKGTAITLAIAIPICMGMFLYVPSIIDVWIGPGHSAAVTPARIFLLFPMLSSANQIGIAMLTAVGQTRKVLHYQLFSVLINLGLSITFVQFFGLKGVVLGTLVSNVALWIPYTRLILTTFNTSVNKWTKNILLPAMTAILTQVTLFAGFQHFLHPKHNFNVLLCGIATLISLGCSYMVVSRTVFSVRD